MDKMKVCVIGGGQVGLPLAVELAHSKTVKVSVVVCDTNHEVVDDIKNKTTKIEDAELKRKLSLSSISIGAECDFVPSNIDTFDYFVVCVNTYVNQHFDVSWVNVLNVVNSIKEQADDPFIIIRSTVPPQAVKKLTEIVGVDNIAFCPERISEGHATTELHSLSQMIGAHTIKAQECCVKLFCALGVFGVHCMTPDEAVIAKLLTNSYRYAHFAIANYFAQICESYGVDYGKIFHNMTANYPRNSSLPKSGFVGGSCLRKDWAMLSGPNVDMSLLLNAYYINERHVDFIFGLVENALDINYGNILQIGMGFKPGASSTRDSLGAKLLSKMIANLPNNIEIIGANRPPMALNHSILVICDTSVSIDESFLDGKVVIDVHQKFNRGIFINNCES